MGTSMKMALTGIKYGFKGAVGFCKRHLPQIMVGLGIAGFAGTAVASGKAAIKARDILDEKEDALKVRHFNEEERKQLNRNTRINLAKTFALPVTLGLASGALILGGHHMLGRKAAAALASAYEAQKKLYQYDKNLTEQLGAEAAEKLRNGLPIDREKAAEAIKKRAEEEKTNPKPKQEPFTGEFCSVPFLFDEASCGFGGGWHKNLYGQWNKIKSAFQYSQDRLRIIGHIDVNDILKEEFAYPSVTGGEHGWICDPHGFGSDEMIWMIDYNGEDIPIKEFLSNRGYSDFINTANEDNGIWITFYPRRDDISKLYNDINSRKRAGIGK